MADEKSGARTTRANQQSADAASQEVAQAFTEGQQQGYTGEVPDEEPNEAYTLRGQASRKIPPGHPGGPAA